MEWWGYGIVAGSILSSIVQWAAKLRWSKEFAAAKDETIRSKDVQIATLEREIKSVRDAKEEMIKLKEAHIAVIERENNTIRSFSSESLQKIYLSTKNQLEEQLSKAREDHEILLSSMMEEVNKLRDGVWSTTKQKFDRITSSLEEMRELIAHQSDNSAVSGPLEESGEGEVSAQLILNEPLCGGTEAS